MKNIAVIILMLVASAPSFAAECKGGEGVNVDPEWAVTWSKNGASKLNRAEQWKVRQTLGNQATITADLELTRTDDTISAKKINVKPGNNSCTYSGTIKGSSVSGTYHCTTGGPYNFALICDWN